MCEQTARATGTADELRPVIKHVNLINTGQNADLFSKKHPFFKDARDGPASVLNYLCKLTFLETFLETRQHSQWFWP